MYIEGTHRGGKDIYPNSLISKYELILLLNLRKNNNYSKIRGKMTI